MWDHSRRIEPGNQPLARSPAPSQLTQLAQINAVEAHIEFTEFTPDLINGIDARDEAVKLRHKGAQNSLADSTLTSPSSVLSR